MMKRLRTHSILTAFKRFKKDARRLQRMQEYQENSYAIRHKIRFLRKRLQILQHTINPLANARMTAVLASLLVGTGVTALAQPTIQNYSPATNATNVARGTNISILFSEAMSSASIDADNILIYGSQTGLRSTEGSFSGNQQLSFNPDLDFRPNELVSVTVTNAQSTSGVLIDRALVYQFRARVAVGSGSFTSSVVTSGNHRAVAIGDLNNDCHNDFIVAGDRDNPQAIYLNNGDQTFASSSIGGGESREIVLGDLDGDGDLDAIVAHFYDTPNDIMLNNGDGTFNTVSFGGGSTQSLTLADLDGDGDLDAVLVDAADELKLWLNNGDATFVSSAMGVSKSYSRVDHGDLDNDGDIDFIVNVRSNLKEVWLNNGDASFTSSALGTVISSGEDTAIGDIDQDGNLDVLFTVQFTREVDIHLGNGDGTFAEDYAGPRNGRRIQLGDLDADGDLDAIVTSPASTGSSIFVNNGNGTFSSKALEGAQIHQAALGDMDNDGDLDLVTVYSQLVSSTANTRLWLNEPRPIAIAESPLINAQNVHRDSDIQIGFSEVMSTAALTVAPQANPILRIWGSQTGEVSDGAAVSFSNGDQRMTIDPANDFRAGDQVSVSVSSAIRSVQGAQASTGIVSQFRVQAAPATARFSTGTTLSIVSRGVGLGDLNADGRLDAYTFGTGSQVHLGFGQKMFFSNTIGFLDFEDVKAGDFDNDGDMDIVFQAYDDQVHIGINNGEGIAPTFGYTKAADFGTFALGDLDADGDLDVVHASPNFQPILLTNNGDATFVLSTIPAGTGLEDPIATDIDSDGDLDLVFKSTNAVYILLNNGRAEFSQISTSSVAVRDMDFGDMDNDGDIDLVLAHESSTTAPTILLNNGDVTFSSMALGTVAPNAIELGDLNGDGNLDVLALRDGSSTIWLNNGDLTFGTSSVAIVSPLDAETGDFDNDGDLDIWVNSNEGVDHVVLFNLPPAPQITLLTPSSTSATLSPFILGVQGSHFESTSASISYRSSSGATLGFRELAVQGNSSTSLSVELISGLVSTAGTLTLQIDAAGGSTSAVFTVTNDQPLIQATEPTVSIAEDSSTTIVLTIDDVWPGLAGLRITPPLTDGSSIASITQVGATTASTQFLIVAAQDFNGSAPLSFSVSDGDLQSTTTVNVNILALNDPPTLQLPAKLTLLPNGVSSATLLLNDVDNNIGDLFVTATSANQNLIADGNLTLGATAASMSLDFVSECHTSGTTQIVITVSDGLASTRQSIDVCILDNSETPIKGATRAACVNNSSPYNALPAQDAINFLWTADGGTILRGQGSAEIDVLWLQGSSNHSISLLRTYANGCTTASSLNLSPSLLTLASDFAATSASLSVTLAVLQNDSGTALSIVALQTPDNGIASHTNGIVTYTPNSGFGGIEVFNYTAENALGCTSAGVIQVAVQEPAARVNLEYLARYKNRSGALRGLNGAINTSVSPDGKFVYVAGRQDHSIAIFARNTSDGLLTYVTRVRNLRGGVSGLRSVQDLAVSSDGRWLFACGYGDNSLVVFSRDISTGELTFSDKRKHGQTDSGGKITALKRPRALALSPDGSNVYVAANLVNSIGVFDFNTLTGEMQWLEGLKDGVGGVDGLKGVLDLAVSPDGLHVYTAGFGEDKIGILARSSSSGTLTYLGQVRDGFNGVDGLNGVRALSVAADGRQLYAAGFEDDALSVFDRNNQSGLLSFVERLKDGQNGVDGLERASNLAVSKAGRQVWTASEHEKAIALFARQDDGRLDFAHRVNININDIRGLDLSNAGQYGYGAASIADAVSVVYRNRQPQAVDDTGHIAFKNAAVQIAALNNDSDADNHSLKIVSKTDGALGTVDITGGGSLLTYNAGTTLGADQFTYTIDDGHGGSSTATVSLMVNNSKKSLLTKRVDDLQNPLEAQVRPNPLRDKLTLHCKLLNTSSLEVILTDLRGAELNRLECGIRSAGTHQIEWDLTSLNLPKGAYTVTLRARGQGSDTANVAEAVEAHISVRIVD